MLIRLFIKLPLLAILFHIGLGFLTKSAPLALAVFYIVITAIALIEVTAARDRSNLAGYYGLYIAGMEILNRMSKSAVFWEFGKYAVIAVFSLGTFLGASKQQRPFLLLAYFLLLLPGILIAAAYGGISEERVRDLISQYLSGPAALLAAGWYFYQRPFPKKELALLLRVGVLPSIAVVTLLLLGKSLSEIDFVGGSNFAASGGFGPNQVSSALGWGIVLVVLGMLFNASITGYLILDIVLLLLLVFRGLLTFSRGGMMGAFGAIGIAMLALYLISATYRNKLKRLLPRLLAGLSIIAVVAVVANTLTDNFLLYRYQGKSTSEVILGKTLDDKNYLSGREGIIMNELESFVKSPLLGIGIGRGTVYREGDGIHERIASHTEFTRMLGEHGLLGLFAIICAFILLPLKHFRKIKEDHNRQWMMTFFILSVFTLMHSGMRLAMPCVAFGLAFIIIIPTESNKGN